MRKEENYSYYYGYVCCCVRIYVCHMFVYLFVCSLGNPATARVQQL